MINVFYNHTFLCIFTTAILYFLQISHFEAAGSLCDPEAPFYKCDDRKTHFLTDKVYYLKKSQEAAPIAAIYVGKQGTIVNASRITVTGDNPDEISQYGAFVQDSGKLILTDSNFKDIPGLRVLNGVIQMNDGKIEGTSHAIYASGKETDVALVRVNVEIKPDNLNANGIGIVSGLDAFVRMSGSTVTFNEIGAFSTKFGGRYLLDTMTIEGKGKKYTAIVDNESVDKLPEAFDIFQGGAVQLRNSSIVLNDMHGFLIKNFSAFVNSRGQPIQNYALSDILKKTNIEIENSNISVQGKGGYGLYFNLLDPNTVAEYYGQKGVSKEPRITLGNASVRLKKTIFTVPDGTAIYVTGQGGYGASVSLDLSEATKISGDLLLKAEKNSSISIKASASSLTGGAHVEDTSTARLVLTRGSTWYLTKSKYKGLQGSFFTDSSLSSVSLSDSTFIFNRDVSSGYQTLRIGNKRYKEAYNAEGNVQIKLSTFLNDDGLFDSQKTDRILIDGDVSGTTLLVMENFSKTSEKEASGEGRNSISLIQVSGYAREDSFKLMGDYTAINGLPYQYRLRAYGPSSSFGKADPRNRLVAGDRDFWDFRLEGIYISPKQDSSTILPIPPSPFAPVDPIPTDPVPTPLPTPITPTPSPSAPSEPSDPVPTDPSSSSSVPVTPTPSPSAPSEPSDPVPTDPSSSSSVPVTPTPSPTPPVPVKPDIQPELGMRAVVPQVPTYLLLPNALFHTGLMDLASQNKKLRAIRSSSRGSLKSDEKTVFFLHAYGGSHHYTSNLSAFEYGYGAELDYNAFEAGVLLNEIENLYSRTFFGALGSYGNLSLAPQDVEQSRKSAFDKWSVAAYGSLQHDTGFYIDGVLSYGLFKGDVLTLARGKVVALKGKQFSGSLTSGKTFATRYKGVVFDPQIQIVYQHLQFNPAYDVDNLDVDLGKFHQWVGRVGGRLSKTLNVSEEGRVVSFYSKLSYLHSFEDKQFVSFKNDFQLGFFGSSLEAGLGFNARLSSKLSLHGDVTYQHKFKKVGFSGASFSAGLRHLF
ncbi:MULTISPECIES: autotransporter outer membrane beta-barrel domain-containing protein [unclassified Bartonella]|uniref:autotransporter outer membrane beta-barrel domain-containing protein n=1 Tax=unclassified Bartonella TaxID=2645622 RepID=UPI0035D08424